MKYLITKAEYTPNYVAILVDQVNEQGQMQRQVAIKYEAQDLFNHCELIDKLEKEGFEINKEKK